jgi:GTPase SAR1 family protein
VKNVKVKIIMAGEPGSGKSFIAQTADACVPARKIGVSIGKVSEAFSDTSVEMTLLTWTITSRRPRERTHLKQAEAAIIVCDLTKQNTVEMTSKWAEKIHEIAGDIPLFFAAINANLETWDNVILVRDVAQKYHSSYFPINTDDLESARKLFRTIAQVLALEFLERKKTTQESIKTFENA